MKKLNKKLPDGEWYYSYDYCAYKDAGGVLGPEEWNKLQFDNVKRPKVLLKKLKCGHLVLTELDDDGKVIKTFACTQCGMEREPKNEKVIRIRIQDLAHLFAERGKCFCCGTELPNPKDYCCGNADCVNQLPEL